MDNEAWLEVEVGTLGDPDASSPFATGPFGSLISSKYFTETGIPVIRGSNLSTDVGVRLVEDDLVFVSDEKAMEFTRSIARRGDLVFTCWGTVGQVGFIGENSRFETYIVSNKQMKMTPNPRRVLPLFLYYLLGSPQMVIEIQRNAIGSSVPGFNLGQLKELRVVLPPVEVQQSIVEVLKALDDKIESNRRIECLLQEILEAGFDRESSAVDWDMPLSDWAVLTRGTEPGRDKCNEDSIGQPFIRVGDLGQDRAALYTDLQNLVVANEDDVLVSFDGTPGRVATGMVGVFSSGIRRVDPVGTAVTKGLLYALFKSSRVQSVISEYATGTTILHAGSAIPHIKVPAFEGGVLMKLASEAEELTAKLRSAKRQRSLLSGLRDALLPELLSGRLRVRDAEKVVEEVV